MSSVTIWLGVTTDSVESPASHVLSFGIIEGKELKQYNEVGLNVDNLDWFQKQILDMIEIIKLTRAELKVVGEEK